MSDDKKMSSYRFGKQTRTKIAYIATYLYELGLISKPKHTKVLEFIVDRYYNKIKDLQD